MKRLKKIMRLVGLLFLILLAACGLGFMAGFQRPREQDYDNEVKTELSEGKEDLVSTEKRN